jgi:hypothetical protein
VVQLKVVGVIFVKVESKPMRNKQTNKQIASHTHPDPQQCNKRWPWTAAMNDLLSPKYGDIVGRCLA